MRRPGKVLAQIEPVDARQLCVVCRTLYCEIAEATGYTLCVMTGVVLTGGKSTRMGRDKATLEFNGQPLAERCVAVLRACFPEVLVVHDDDRPGLGPIGGLLTALRRAPEIFVVACDMPFLDAALIRAMAAQLPGYDAVAIPGEPLHAAYSARIVPVIEAQIATGDYSLRRLLAQISVKTVAAAPIVNVNTPQEWEAVCGRFQNDS
jgi:molybdopterin-guanine dinucleotide biosynthesis protein A